MINLTKESAPDNLIADIYSVIERVIPCPYMDIENKKAYLKEAGNFIDFIDILVNDDAPNGYFLTNEAIYNYLRENDPDLSKSLKLLEEKGYEIENCQAWLLAELLVKEYKKNYLFWNLQKYETQINDFLNY